ncbi:hypothetical protein I4F81_000480 [Pyropia yezoensis]|uniref:Uncharacterized protein n=1 Tax=Pyropia yezoensis TaxID=2788 RepID=A0ACC3BIT8_PYRYE|nr:hypothetical protein I4F81_000480 [Neopyropia yezoensis]
MVRPSVPLLSPYSPALMFLRAAAAGQGSRLSIPIKQSPSSSIPKRGRVSTRETPSRPRWRAHPSRHPSLVPLPTASAAQLAHSSYGPPRLPTPPHPAFPPSSHPSTPPSLLICRRCRRPLPPQQVHQAPPCARPFAPSPLFPPPQGGPVARSHHPHAPVHLRLQLAVPPACTPADNPAGGGPGGAVIAHRHGRHPQAGENLLAQTAASASPLPTGRAATTHPTAGGSGGVFVAAAATTIPAASGSAPLPPSWTAALLVPPAQPKEGVGVDVPPQVERRRGSGGADQRRAAPRQRLAKRPRQRPVEHHAPATAVAVAQ